MIMTTRIHQVGLSCNPLPPTGYGGIETVITNLARGLVDLNVPVTCYAPQPFGIPGASHYATLQAATPGPKQGVATANTLEHLANAVDGIISNWCEGDIIHLHHWQQYPFFKDEFSKRGLSRRVRWLETAHWTMAGLPDNIAYPSSALAAAIRKPGKVVPHGIDTTLFAQADHGSSTAHDYVLYAGRVTPDKGVHIGVEAAKEYGIECRIAGPVVDAEYADTFMTHATYLGELDAAALACQYQGALAVLYMTQYIEPFGLSAVEAMACGSPVITTGLGGTGETVIDGKTGIYCRSRPEVTAAFDKVRGLSRDACAARGRTYSIAASAEAYLRVYGELCAE